MSLLLLLSLLFITLPSFITLKPGTILHSHTRFVPAGTVSHAPSTIHLRFQANMNIYIHACEALRAMASSHSTVFQPKDYKQFKERLNLTCSSLHTFDSEYQIFNLHGTSPLSTRHKRQLLIGLGLLAGTLFGAFSLYKVHQLESTVENLSNTTDVMHRILNVENMRVNRLESMVLNISKQTTAQRKAIIKSNKSNRRMELAHELMQSLHHLCWQIDAFNRGFVTLITSHRVNTDLLSPTDAQELWQKVYYLAHHIHRGFVPFSTPSVIYQLDASFLMKQNGMISIYIHVPVVQRRLNLFRLDHSPLIMQQDNDFILMDLLVPTTKQIAVTADHNLFMEIDNVELNSCFRFESNYFCDNMFFLQKDFTHTCMAALFTMNEESFCKVCPVRRSSLKFYLKHLYHQNKIEIFSIDTIPITQKCSNGSVSTKQVRGQHLIDVYPGCDISSNDFQVEAPMKSVQEIDSGIITNKIIVNITSWLGHNSLKKINLGLNKLEELHIPASPHLPALFSQLDQLERSRPSLSNSTFFSMLSHLGPSFDILHSIILLIITIFCGYLGIRLLFHCIMLRRRIIPTAPPQTAPAPSYEMQPRQPAHNTSQ